MTNYLFYTIKRERVQYLGMRLFRWNQRSNEVLQIHLGGGEPKRGRNANFGIYMISTPTFFSNYLAMGYAVPCTKTSFKKAFDKVIQVLKTN